MASHLELATRAENIRGCRRERTTSVRALLHELQIFRGAALHVSTDEFGVISQAVRIRYLIFFAIPLIYTLRYFTRAV